MPGEEELHDVSMTDDLPGETDTEEVVLSDCKTIIVYIMLVVAFFAIQFGHGANIGLAVSLPGDSKAANMALGTWVILGVCVGLPIVPRACKKFGTFKVVQVCIIADLLAICLMLYPGVTVHQIYAARFLVGFFESPFMPFLQLWLTQFGKTRWNLWNTCMHAMVPLGSSVGYFATQYLVDHHSNWQYAFCGQVLAVAGAVAVCYLFAGRDYLEVRDQNPEDDKQKDETNEDDDREIGASPDDASRLLEEKKKKSSASEMQFPERPQCAIYWACNVSLALQLGFMNGTRFAIREYGEALGFDPTTISTLFTLINLVCPAIAGAVPMSGMLFRPDQWSQHRKTLTFLFGTATVAAVLSMLLKRCTGGLFWVALAFTFLAAGGVYPAAQGIIQTSLTKARVIEASAYQVMCNNVLFAAPMPFLLGWSFDTYGVDFTWYCTISLQVLVAAGFGTSLLCSMASASPSQIAELEEPL